jgi:hypothetical protein
MKATALLATSLTGLALLAWIPAQGRTLWIRCGDDQVNLDMRQGQYQARVGIRMFNGQPQIDAQKVVVTTNWTSSSTDNRMLYQLVVDRNTLAYKRQVLVRLPSEGGGEYWDATEEQSGQCNLMAINYNGKRI